MAPSQKTALDESRVIDIKTDTRGIISTLIFVGLITAAFLVFLCYYGLLWTPGKPWDMMQ